MSQPRWVEDENCQLVNINAAPYSVRYSHPVFWWNISQAPLRKHALFRVPTELSEEKGRSAAYHVLSWLYSPSVLGGMHSRVVRQEEIKQLVERATSDAAK